MNLVVHTTVLPHDDPEASLIFYRDALGFAVESDVGRDKMRWIVMATAGEGGTRILLAPPAPDPGITDTERRTISEMMAKGTYGWIMLASDDLQAAFDQIQAGGAEVVQEPSDQPWGTRDCAFRDPAGNMVRIQQAN